MKIEEQIDIVGTICTSLTSYSEPVVQSLQFSKNLVDSSPWLTDQVVMKGSKYNLKRKYSCKYGGYYTPVKYGFFTEKSKRFIRRLKTRIQGPLGKTSFNLIIPESLLYLPNRLGWFVFDLVTCDQYVHRTTEDAGKEHLKPKLPEHLSWLDDDDDDEELNALLFYHIIPLPPNEILYCNQTNSTQWQAAFDLAKEMRKSLDYQDPEKLTNAVKLEKMREQYRSKRNPSLLT